MFTLIDSVILIVFIILSFAVISFQFIVQGYNALAYTGQILIFVIIWAVLFRIRRSVAPGSWVMVAVAAMIFSIFPIDITFVELSSGDNAGFLGTLVLRMLVHSLILGGYIGVTLLVQRHTGQGSR
jgi:CBS domain containing-hemolysin-like protein